MTSRWLHRAGRLALAAIFAGLASAGPGLVVPARAATSLPVGSVPTPTQPAFAPLPSEDVFPEVNLDPGMGDEVAFLDRQGIVEGFPDGTFQPDGLVTRADGQGDGHRARPAGRPGRRWAGLA